MQACRARPLGLAIVGAGAFARSRHLPAWSRLADSRLRWVVDIDPSAARDAAERWRVERWTDDVSKVLADPAVEAVDLCTPPEVHAEQAIAILEAGKHVLVEKPAACTLAEVCRVVESAEAAGKVAMVAENWLFCDGMFRAQRLIEEGALGDLLSMVVIQETGSATARVKDQQRSGLLNAGVHGVNTLRALLGDPTHVAAFSLHDRTGAPAGAASDTVMNVSLRFTAGRVGALILSARAQRKPPGVREVRIQGTRGMVHYDVLAGWLEQSESAWLGGPCRRSQAEKDPFGVEEEISRFVAAIRGEASAHPSVRHQIQTHRILEAIRRSAQELITVAVAPAEASGREVVS